MTDEGRVEDGGSGGAKRTGRAWRGFGARRDDHRVVGEDLEDYEKAQVRLESVWRPDTTEEGPRNQGGKALSRAASDLGLGKAMFRSGSAVHVHAFGRARSVVRLVEWLGNLGFGGYRLVLNTRHDVAFGGPEFVDEVEIASIMLPHLLDDPSRSKPCWGRTAYRALLEDS